MLNTANKIDSNENNHTQRKLTSLMKLVDKNLGLVFFTFHRITLDNGHIVLSSHPELVSYLQNQATENNSLPNNYNPQWRTNTYNFWSSVKDNKRVEFILSCGIADGVSLVKIQPNGYRDIYHFGFDQKLRLDSSQLNELVKILEYFIITFKSNTLEDIIAAEKDAVYYPNEINPDLAGTLDKDNAKEILRSCRRVRLNNNPNIYLTPKEIDVLIQLAHGASCVEVSNSLFISNRTVETHILNLKRKLNCNSLFELGAKAKEFGII